MAHIGKHAHAKQMLLQAHQIHRDQQALLPLLLRQDMKQQSSCSCVQLGPASLPSLTVLAGKAGQMTVLVHVQMEVAFGPASLAPQEL